jgi:hypothetical protein
MEFIPHDINGGRLNSAAKKLEFPVGPEESGR